MIYVSFFRIRVFRETFSPTNIWPATPKLHIGKRRDIQVACPLILPDETQIGIFMYTLVELPFTRLPENSIRFFSQCYTIINRWADIVPYIIASFYKFFFAKALNLKKYFTVQDGSVVNFHTFVSTVPSEGFHRRGVSVFRMVV